MTIEEQALEFINKNPHIWDLFCNIKLNHIDEGDRVTQAHIFSIIRDYEKVSTEDDNSHFKISNIYSPTFARLFMAQFPEYPRCFKIKQMLFGRLDKDRDKSVGGYVCEFNKNEPLEKAIKLITLAWTEAQQV